MPYRSIFLILAAILFISGYEVSAQKTDKVVFWTADGCKDEKFETTGNNNCSYFEDSRRLVRVVENEGIKLYVSVRAYRGFYTLFTRIENLGSEKVSFDRSNWRVYYYRSESDFLNGATYVRADKKIRTIPATPSNIAHGSGSGLPTPLMIVKNTDVKFEDDLLVSSFLFFRDIKPKNHINGTITFHFRAKDAEFRIAYLKIGSTSYAFTIENDWLVYDSLQIK